MEDEEVFAQFALVGALQKAYEDYTTFLEDEINGWSVYLMTHGFRTPKEKVDKGIALRAEIATLKEKVNGSR